MWSHCATLLISQIRHRLTPICPSLLPYADPFPFRLFNPYCVPWLDVVSPHYATWLPSGALLISSSTSPNPHSLLPLGDPLPLPLVQSLSCSLTGCQPTLKFNVVPNATLYISGYIFAQPDPTPSSAWQLRYVPTLSSHMVPRTNALNWLSELVFSLLPLSFLGNYSFPTYLSDLLYLVLSTPYHYPAQCDDALYKLPHPFWHPVNHLQPLVSQYPHSNTC